MQSIIDGTSTGNRASYEEAAVALEDMADAGELPRGDEFYATICSALCYDMARMRCDAVRMYRLLEQRYSGEFEYIVGSPAHSRRLVEGLALLGVGGGSGLLASALDETSRWLHAKASPERGIDHDSPDDYKLFFALLNLLCRFFEAPGRRGSDRSAKDLAERAGRFYNDLLRYFPDPPLGFMVSLYLRLVEATYDHSVSRLGLADGMGAALWMSGRYALTPPGEAAVEAGLIGRASMVCRLPAGPEKALLSCLCLAAPSNGGGRVAYLAANEQAVERAYGGIVGLIGADRGGGDERRDDGPHGLHRDGPGSGGHFVATYEELGTRLSAGSIEVSDLAAVIIDEACDLDEDCGGSGALDLEMLIARLRSAGSSCPQIVALTTLASADVAKKMASWLGAKAVDACGAEGRPGCAVIGTRESVCYNGMPHFRSAPGSHEPLPHDLRCGGGAAGRSGAASLCARFAGRAVVDDSPVLISVPPGSDVIGFASEVASQLRRIESDDLDMGEAAGKKAALRQSLVGRPAIGAGIEYCGTGSESPLASGVAFDDERLPPAFRKAVMRGVESGAISALVSSSVPCTRDAPSPFKTVLLCRPAARGEIPSAFEYARATEMAGRAGLDRKGETFVAAASQAEYDALRRSLWDIALSVTSGLGGSRDDLRPRIALHLIRMAKELGGATPGDMASRISATWFWASSSASDKAALDETIRGLLDELVALDLVARDACGTSAGHICRPTDFGNLVCESHLPVLHAASAVRKLRRIRDDDDAPALQLCSDLALGGDGISRPPIAGSTHFLRYKSRGRCAPVAAGCGKVRGRCLGAHAPGTGRSLERHAGACRRRMRGGEPRCGTVHV